MFPSNHLCPLFHAHSIVFVLGLCLNLETIASIWLENILAKLPSEIICFEKQAVFQEKLNIEELVLSNSHIFAPNGGLSVFYP